MAPAKIISKTSTSPIVFAYKKVALDLSPVWNGKRSEEGGCRTHLPSIGPDPWRGAKTAQIISLTAECTYNVLFFSEGSWVHPNNGDLQVASSSVRQIGRRASLIYLDPGSSTSILCYDQPPSIIRSPADRASREFGRRAKSFSSATGVPYQELLNFELKHLLNVNLLNPGFENARAAASWHLDLLRMNAPTSDRSTFKRLPLASKPRRSAPPFPNGPDSDPFVPRTQIPSLASSRSRNQAIGLRASFFEGSSICHSLDKEPDEKRQKPTTQCRGNVSPDKTVLHCFEAGCRTTDHLSPFEADVLHPPTLISRWAADFSGPVATCSNPSRDDPSRMSRHSVALIKPSPTVRLSAEIPPTYILASITVSWAVFSRVFVLLPSGERSPDPNPAGSERPIRSPESISFYEESNERGSDEKKREWLPSLHFLSFSTGCTQRKGVFLVVLESHLPFRVASTLHLSLLPITTMLLGERKKKTSETIDCYQVIPGGRSVESTHCGRYPSPSRLNGGLTPVLPNGEDDTSLNPNEPSFELQVTAPTLRAQRRSLAPSFDPSCACLALSLGKHHCRPNIFFGPTHLAP
ncbi:hypothetical protein ACRALDRAFT_205379 [Sodiomyces alcalophilus JCM 7366]|uniref:uncharacterized protein n=1 Tax=Sodiomyces alcalophilus JCM 7366 TaxID=591952 RepID=UPI0039B5CCDC